MSLTAETMFDVIIWRYINEFAVKNIYLEEFFDYKYFEVFTINTVYTIQCGPNRFMCVS